MHDLTALQMAAGGAPSGDPKFLDIDPSAQDGDDFTIAGDNDDVGGRPSELGKGEGSYGTDDHVRGRDPLGFGTYKKDYKNPDRTIKEVSRITKNMPSKKQIISETFDKKQKTYDDTGGLLDENNLLAEDSNGN